MSLRETCYPCGHSASNLFRNTRGDVLNRQNLARHTSHSWVMALYSADTMVGGIPGLAFWRGMGVLDIRGLASGLMLFALSGLWWV
jgi:hypothetical protein